MSMIRKRLSSAVFALVAVVVLSNTTPSTAQAPPVTNVTARITPPAPIQPNVNDTLRALAKLEHFGYTIDSQADALRAIKHWQKVNGLVVDGIVGPQTLRSLDLVTVGAPAVRLNPPAPPPVLDHPVPQGPEDIKNLIRSIWPDDLEEHAIRIVSRETGRTFDPSVRNSCCFGLFQIYWNVHRGWLTDMGITSSDMLFDPVINISVVLALSYRSLDATGNGWQPWGG
jgi:Putative peptidoglycan binding domain